MCAAYVILILIHGICFYDFKKRTFIYYSILIFLINEQAKKWKFNKNI